MKTLRTVLFIRRTIFVASLALVAWLPTLPVQAADQPSGGSPPSVSTEGSGILASGAVEDTLKACLARIPKDASAGQQMVAKQSCGSDEETRRLMHTAPKF